MTPQFVCNSIVNYCDLFFNTTLLIFYTSFKNIQVDITLYRFVILKNRKKLLTNKKTSDIIPDINAKMRNSMQKALLQRDAGWCEVSGDFC